MGTRGVLEPCWGATSIAVKKRPNLAPETPPLAWEVPGQARVYQVAGSPWQPAAAGECRMATATSGAQDDASRAPAGGEGPDCPRAA